MRRDMSPEGAPLVRRLSALCVFARDDRLFKNPIHLVHPVMRELILFDVRSEAVSPDCGASSRRPLNMVSLVEPRKS